MKLPARILAIALCQVTFCTIYSPRLHEYDPELRQAFLYNTVNRTFEGDIHVELNMIIREEFHRKGDFLLTDEPEAARIAFYPEFIVYRKEGRLFDQYRTATRYDLIVAAKMRIVRFDSNANEVIAVVREMARTGYSETEGLPETEQRARERVLRLLARKLNESAVQEWLRVHQPNS